MWKVLFNVKIVLMNLFMASINRYDLFMAKFSIQVDPGGSVVITLTSGSEVRGFKPGRDRWIFFRA